MMDDDRDELLNQDWAATWGSLPEAPEIVVRPKTAQITLRVPPSLLARLKRVAVIRGLPYHALARSWIVDGVREALSQTVSTAPSETQSRQLNIKFAQESLDSLKKEASRQGLPYHRLARTFVEAAVVAEEESLGIVSSAGQTPAIKDLMVFLLHAQNQSGKHSVRGMTQLQKLLFVVEETLSRKGGFYAYNYGPFNEEVNDAAEALRIAGFLEGADKSAGDRPTFDEMMDTIVNRAGPKPSSRAAMFALNEEGHEAAERLRHSSATYEDLYEQVATLRTEWDTPELLERVYGEFPEYTEQSLIKDEVAERRERRQKS